MRYKFECSATLSCENKYFFRSLKSSWVKKKQKEGPRRNQGQRLTNRKVEEIPMTYQILVTSTKCFNNLKKVSTDLDINDATTFQLLLSNEFCTLIPRCRTFHTYLRTFTVAGICFRTPSKVHIKLLSSGQVLNL